MGETKKNEFVHDAEEKIARELEKYFEGVVNCGELEGSVNWLRICADNRVGIEKNDR